MNATLHFHHARIASSDFDSKLEPHLVAALVFDVAHGDTVYPNVSVSVKQSAGAPGYEDTIEVSAPSNYGGPRLNYASLARACSRTIEGVMNYWKTPEDSPGVRVVAFRDRPANFDHYEDVEIAEADASDSQ